MLCLLTTAWHVLQLWIEETAMNKQSWTGEKRLSSSLKDGNGKFLILKNQYVMKHYRRPWNKLGVD
jgi:hypothetical protein